MHYVQDKNGCDTWHLIVTVTSSNSLHVKDITNEVPTEALYNLFGWNNVKKIVFEEWVLPIKYMKYILDQYLFSSQFNFVYNYSNAVCQM